MHLEYDHHYSPDDVDRKTSLDFSSKVPTSDNGYESQGNVNINTASAPADGKPAGEGDMSTLEYYATQMDNPTYDSNGAPVPHEGSQTIPGVNVETEEGLSLYGGPTTKVTVEVMGDPRVPAADTFTN